MANDSAVTEERLARTLEYLADNPEEGQGQDVDLRVAEEPEQVLPAAPAVADVEHLSSQLAVGAQPAGLLPTGKAVRTRMLVIRAFR